MKTRNGFVSNSSSSSFIVLLNHKPKSVEDLKEMMFPRWSGTDVISYEYIDKTMTVAQVVEQVFNDINNGQKDKYNCDNAKDALHGYIGEVYNDINVRLFRTIYDDKSSKEYETYHMLGKKYGYESKDMKKWSKDELYPEYLKRKKEAEKAHNAYLRKRNLVASEIYKRFRKSYKYHKFETVLEYADGNGEGLMEHGNIFRNVPHLTISNH